MLTLLAALVLAPIDSAPADFAAEIGLEMLSIPAGNFMMGSAPSERGRGADEAQHRVTLSADFLIAAHELTRDQWKAVMGSAPGSFRDSGDLPVEGVSWFDALRFCNGLSEHAGLEPVYTIVGTSAHWNRRADGYRLPTETEWEYACRAGTTSHFWVGDRDRVMRRGGWFGDNSARRPHPVAGKAANPWGLYDVHGNVWEWCWDHYGEYPAGPLVDPTGPAWGASRVIRGGGWNTVARQCRSATRHYYEPDNYCYVLGLRVARSIAAGWAPGGDAAE